MDRPTLSSFRDRFHGELRYQRWIGRDRTSACIFALGKTLERFGAVVGPLSDRERKHLLTLCDAAGRWLSQLSHPGLMHEPQEARERLAYLYGWAVVRACGLDITRQYWRKHYAHVLDRIDLALLEEAGRKLVEQTKAEIEAFTGAALSKAWPKGRAQ